MKEVVNTVGTIITVVALVLAIVIGGTLLSILAGIGVVYTMFFHDEYLKHIWKSKWDTDKQKETDEYNAEVDKYNAEADAYNKEVEA